MRLYTLVYLQQLLTVFSFLFSDFMSNANSMLMKTAMTEHTMKLSASTGNYIASYDSLKHERLWSSQNYHQPNN